MKNRTVLIAIGALALLILIVIIIARGNGSETPSASLGDGPHEAYLRLRNVSLSVQPEDAGLPSIFDPDTPYGVIMEEWFDDDEFYTLAVFGSGDASLYTSTGGGILGGIGYEEVRTAARDLVISSNDYAAQMDQVESYPLPERDQVNFYLITPSGVLKAVADQATIRRGGGEYVDLYLAAHDVITKLQLATDDTQE